ncbi:MAG: hypothetical protein HYR60_26825 [Acidobacteria bacterium]|nr:hypothetical protein [Acidobacteriota bacterium]
MNVKFLLAGALAAGLTIFVWESVSHAALPWHEAYLKQFKDGPAVVKTLQANMQGNGMYFQQQGVFAAISFLPDMADKTHNITGNLVIQFVNDVVLAGLLAVLALRLRGAGVAATGGALALAGLAAGVATRFPDWNWYGFVTAHALIYSADLVIGWFLGGVVLAGLMKKMIPA